MDKKTPVGVLGATGMVGQHFVKFLQNHPWFELVWAWSERPFGREKVRRGHELAAGRLDARAVADLTVAECRPDNAPPEPSFPPWTPAWPRK